LETCGTSGTAQFALDCLMIDGNLGTFWVIRVELEFNE
jgi:hypothetical protein